MIFQKISSKLDYKCVIIVVELKSTKFSKCHFAWKSCVGNIENFILIGSLYMFILSPKFKKTELPFANNLKIL